MKTETMIYVLSIVLLMAGTVYFLSYFFYDHLEFMRKNYSESRMSQTNFLTSLCAEAIAGADFGRLDNIVSKRCQQGEVLKAVVLDHPGQKIMVSAAKEEYRAILKHERVALMRKENDPFYGEPADATSSKAFFQVTAPIFVAQKRWATLIILFDTSCLVQGENALRRKMVILGLFVFFAGSILIFFTGKLVARHCSVLLQNMHAHPADIFACPDLRHNTVLGVKASVSPRRQRLSSDERKIIKAVQQKKQIRHILESSSVDELLTFELISGLVVRGILEVR